MNNTTIDYVPAPDFPDSDAASQFDRTVFANDPGRKAFLRRCSPNELPPGQYEAMCGRHEATYGAEAQMFKLVVQIFKGLRVGALLSAPSSQSPDEFCASLRTDPAIAELIKNLRGGGHGKN